MVYIKNNKLFGNKCKIKSINPNVIPSHINSFTSSKLVGKNASTDRAIYSTQDPINNNFDGLSPIDLGTVYLKYK